MRTRLFFAGLAVLSWVGLFVGCGGPQNVRPSCIDDYNQCINACAYRCEGGGIEVEPAFSTDNTTFDTWDAGCQQCTSQCDDVADRCAEREADDDSTDM